MSDYKVEFPDFESAIPPVFLTAPWVDHSWHNDATPSFARPLSTDGREIHVFVDEADPAKRWEAQGCPRYSVYTTDTKGSFCDDPVFIDEDLAKVLDHIETLLRDDLNREYDAWLKARPYFTDAGTADDLYADCMMTGGTSEEDLAWLHGFIDRWERAFR